MIPDYIERAIGRAVELLPVENRADATNLLQTAWKAASAGDATEDLLVVLHMEGFRSMEARWTRRGLPGAPGRYYWIAHVTLGYSVRSAAMEPKEVGK